MAAYKPLKQLSEGSYSAVDVEWPTQNARNAGSRRNLLLIFCLVLTNIVTLSYNVLKPSDWSAPDDFDIARTRDFSVEYKRFWWNTAYSPGNRSRSSQLWDAIRPSHGIVAVDKKYAASRGWPLSHRYPGDSSKSVYLLEAYHQLHCLKIIRKTFWEAVDGRPYTYHPDGHLDHCFDTLRQSVQCNADMTPLYSWGKFKAGDGQMHRCRNWDELRDWATEHTACYEDSIEHIPLKDHFGHCDDGTDGVGAIDEGAITGLL